MATRKIYLSIGKPSARKARAIRTWTIKTENQMMNAQAEIAELIAEDFFDAQEREQMEDDVEVA